MPGAENEGSGCAANAIRESLDTYLVAGGAVASAIVTATLGILTKQVVSPEIAAGSAGLAQLAISFLGQRTIRGRH